MRIRFVFAVIAFLSINAAGAGTFFAFTYQGLLTENGSPFTGQCEITGDIFLDEMGGSFLASQTLPGIDVEQGIFTAVFDYGTPVFDATLELPRWLELTLDCGTNRGPVVLSPRQQVTPSPQAQYARQAGVAFAADFAFDAATVDGANAADLLDKATYDREMTAPSTAPTRPQARPGPD